MPLENNYKGLYRLKGPSRTKIPDSTSIPNVAPLAAAPIPDDTTQPTDNFGNLTSLVGTLKGGSPGTIPGQLPGTDFNMGAVDTTSLGQRTAQTTSKEFDADKFARMAGAFGAAISPSNSWQSKLGEATSALGLENLKERRDAPGRELDARYKEAQIKKLETPETASTAMGAFLKRNPDASNDEVADYALKLKGEGSGPTTAMGAFLKRNPEATPEEVANYSRSLKDGGYHYETDDKGDVSVYQYGKLIKGTGKGKGKSSEAGEKPSLYTSSMNQILKEYGGAGTSFKTDPATGAVSFSTGGEKAYKEMAQQAQDGNPSAKKNLARYESLKQKLFSLAGEDVSTDTSQTTPSWKDYR